MGEMSGQTLHYCVLLTKKPAASLALWLQFPACRCVSGGAGGGRQAASVLRGSLPALMTLYNFRNSQGQGESPNPTGMEVNGSSIPSVASSSTLRLQAQGGGFGAERRQEAVLYGPFLTTKEEKT